MHDKRTVTRRAAVACGLGALAALPAAALADTVSRLGYKADGTAYEGLVTVEGKTYLYEGGVKFTGGQKEYKGTRYFYKSDGHMAVSEKVTWDDGTEHEYDSDGVLNDTDLGTVLAEGDLADGWYRLTNKGTSSRVLDVANACTTNGTKVQMYESNDSQAQKWRIMWDKTVGARRIETSAASLQCADEGLTGTGHQAHIWSDGTHSNGKAWTNQRWVLSKCADGSLIITNADNGLALTAGEDKNSASVTLETAAGEDNQKWVLEATESWGGWWQDGAGNHHVNNPSDGMMVRNARMVDPVYKNGGGVDDGWGSVYDFDGTGNATWHLPTYDDLPGGAHGDVDVPSIERGDRRQRSIMYALSRVGCSYALNNQPHQFVCDGLTEWSYERGTGEEVGAADGQWQLVKGRDGDPWQRDLGSLKPGDLVFFGSECLTWYEGALGANGWPDYHAGMYYSDGKMINARGATGVTKDTSVAAYSGYGDTGDGSGGMGWAYLGGGSPYAHDTSRFGVPHM